MGNPLFHQFQMVSNSGYAPGLMPFYQQHLHGSMPGFMPGQVPMHRLPSMGTTANPWTSSMLYTHGTCSQCDVLALHLSLGLITDDKTYKAVTAKRAEHYRHSAPNSSHLSEPLAALHEQIGKLNTQLANLWENHKQFLVDYNCQQDNLSRVQGERHWAFIEWDKHKTHMSQLRDIVTCLETR